MYGMSLFDIRHAEHHFETQSALVQNSYTVMSLCCCNTPASSTDVRLTQILLSAFVKASSIVQRMLPCQKAIISLLPVVLDHELALLPRFGWKMKERQSLFQV